jgi:glyoxylase-like metal-dependent hydrolase (beta-lactamase superfamily II)
MENFSYLIGDKKTKECFCVDPAWDADAVIREAEKDGMNIIGALVTHAHYDHVNAVEPFAAKTKGRIYVHRAEAGPLAAVKNRLVPTGEGMQIAVGKIRITCIHTPGHSPGAQCFLVQAGDAEGGSCLLTGDTLFVGACGRCDLASGDAGQLRESLKKLAKLDEQTVVLPGHDYGDRPTSTIGREKKTNPYMSAASLR